MLDDWPVRFLGCEPVAHLLRAALPDRWVRFHNLPDSKRYPGNQAEYDIVLDRQNQILDELVDGGSSIILLTTEYSGPPGTVEVSAGAPLPRSIDRGAKPWRSVPMHDLDGDFVEPSYWYIFSSELVWWPRVLDPVLRLVADDAIANVMVLPPDCRWLFHPYDGGMDVILETPDARDRLKSAHADWLSPRPDGM